MVNVPTRIRSVLRRRTGNFGARASPSAAGFLFVAALLASAAILGWVAFGGASPARAQTPPETAPQDGEDGQEAQDGENDFNSLCFLCHADPDFETVLPSGETLPLYVDQRAFEASVHGGLECIACHPEQLTIPHWPVTAEDRRTFTVERARPCETCHQEAAKSYAKSVHGVTQLLGFNGAAVCSDCHTNHEVQHPDDWSNAERAERCQQCHEGADANFASGWLGHREPSPSWFPIAFYAERFLIILTASVLGFGIVHVELEVMRWAIDRFWRKGK
jgi:hypothetical protein